MEAENNIWLNFISEWGIQFEKVKQLLDFLKSSPNFIEVFEITNINDSKTIEESQKEWLYLQSKFYHPLEIKFFKPHWIPLCFDGYDFFIDISTEKFSLIDHSYFFLEPYQWYQKALYNNISDLIVDCESTERLENKKHYNDELEMEMFRKCMFERELLGLSGKIFIEPITFDEIFDADEGYKNDLFVWDGEKTTFTNVGSLIVGLFPFKTKIYLEKLLFNFDIELDNNKKIKTIQDVVFILRENGIHRVKSYKIKIGKDVIVEYNCPTFMISGSNDVKIDEFCRDYMKFCGIFDTKN